MFLGKIIKYAIWKSNSGNPDFNFNCLLMDDCRIGDNQVYSFKKEPFLDQNGLYLVHLWGLWSAGRHPDIWLTAKNLRASSRWRGRRRRPRACWPTTSPRPRAWFDRSTTRALSSRCSCWGSNLKQLLVKIKNPVKQYFGWNGPPA